MASPRAWLKLFCFMCTVPLGIASSSQKQGSPDFPGSYIACRTTPYPQLCARILRSSSSPTGAPLNRQIAIVSSFALNLTSSSYNLAKHLVQLPPPPSASRLYKGALQDCKDLMGSTMDQLQLSISRISHLNAGHTSSYNLLSQVMDAQVSLSASFTYQDTCSDELHQRKALPLAATQLLKQVKDTSRAVTVALAMTDTLHRHASP